MENGSENGSDEEMSDMEKANDEETKSQSDSNVGKILVEMAKRKIFRKERSKSYRKAN